MEQNINNGEDFVEYYLFSNEFIDETPSEEFGALEKLNSLLCFIHAIVTNYTQDYIWHKESINFKIVTYNTPHETGRDVPCPHIHGITHFGDNIEDEWLIVFLLFKLSRQIKGLIIRVVDSDGEFLLIEAADHLPKWANPETCENRVFVCDGAIHLVHDVKSSQPPASSKKVPITAALAEVKRNPSLTMAPELVQSCIKNRIAKYPKKIKECLQNTHVFVPIDVAALLKQKPALIAPAVQAFCERDPADMKVCRMMKYFPPETRVMANVTFTKLLYAMLLHQKFVPDRITGWNMPPSNSQDFKPYDLGAKLACGFEILISQAKSGSSSQCSDGVSDASWNQYVANLQSVGYFKDLLRGSKEYTELLDRARSYYEQHFDATQHSEPTTGAHILTLMQNSEFDRDEIRTAAEKLPPADDDSWMTIKPDELEAMLQSKYGCANKLNISGSGLSEIPKTLRKFLDQVSSLDGAEFSDAQNENSPPEEQEQESSQAKSMSSESGEHVSKVDFRAEDFSSALQNVLDFVIPDDNWDLESDSDLSGVDGSADEEYDFDLTQKKSGEKKKKKEQRRSREMAEYMKMMDKELSSTCIMEGFEKAASKEKKGDADEDNFDDVEDFHPVDIDMTAMKNVLESYQSQMGQSGPASNLLGPLGIHLENVECAKGDET